jgi:hypothetical protein
VIRWGEGVSCCAFLCGSSGFLVFWFLFGKHVVLRRCTENCPDEGLLLFSVVLHLVSPGSGFANGTFFFHQCLRM